MANLDDVDDSKGMPDGIHFWKAVAGLATCRGRRIENVATASSGKREVIRNLEYGMMSNFSVGNYAADADEVVQRGAKKRL